MTKGIHEKQILFMFDVCLLCMKGSLSCHTCCDTGPHFFAVSLEGPSNIVAFYDKQGVPMTHSNLDPYGGGGTNIHVLTPPNFESKWGYKSPAFDPPSRSPGSHSVNWKPGGNMRLYAMQLKTGSRFCWKKRVCKKDLCVCCYIKFISSGSLKRKHFNC